MFSDPSHPARTHGRRNKRPRKYDPHAGVKASDIRRTNATASAAPVGDREKTGHGYIVPVFSNDNFSTYYEMIYAGNHTGFGVNEKADRVIRVLSGSVYVTEEVVRRGGKPERRIRKLTTGHHFTIPRGKKAGYGTSGVDFAEVFVVENVGYGDTWEVLEDATFSDAIQPLEKPSLELSRHRDHSTNSKAMQQAQAMGAQRNARKRRAGTRKVDNAAARNANSGTTLGVNPQPMGPPPADD
jgi:hypothetical protein